MDILNDIKQKAGAYYNEVVSVRRHLHRYPELSKQEVATADFLCAQLDGIEGVSYRKGVGGNGIVGYVEGQHPEQFCVAIRADMDALPIQECTSLSFASNTPGVMHACGHDVHMACLLGAIKIFSDLRHLVEGRLMFIFQPSEEEYPGGAFMMLEDDIWDNETKPDVIFALHTTPEMETGEIGMKPGKYMASTDEFFLKVKGKGGHGATPNLNIDPIVIASHIVVAMQTVVSRNADPTIPTTLSFGKIIGSGRTNIIPNEVLLEGIVRTFDETWRKEIHQKIVQIAQGVAQSFGGECEVVIDSGYPCLENDATVTAQTFSRAQAYLGDDKVHILPQRMTAEDFAYFAQQIPACYFRLGTKKKDGQMTNLHSDTFDVDEKCLEIGMGLMAWIACCSLQGGRSSHK